MKPFGALAAVLSLFVVGVLAGVLGTHLYYAHQLRQPGGPPTMRHEFLLERLVRELDLDDEQRQRVGEILRSSREQAEQIRHEVEPRVRTLTDQVHERIRDVLTPEQQRQLETWRERRGRRLDELILGPPPHPPRRGRRGPPPPGTD